jgi:hypothetical protein
MAKNLDNHVRQRDLLIIEPQGQALFAPADMIE